MAKYETIPLHGDRHGRSALVRLRLDGRWEGFVAEIGGSAEAVAIAKSDLLLHLYELALRYDHYYGH